MWRQFIIPAFCCLIAPANVFGSDFSFAVGARAIAWEEVSLDGQRLVSETGVLPLLALAADIPFSSDWMLSAFANHSRGELEYDGRLQSGNSFRSSTRAETLSFGVSLISPTIKQAFGAAHSLQFGIGFTNRSRRISGSAGVSELREEYHLPAIRLGWHAQWPFLHTAFITEYHYDSSVKVTVPDQAYGSIRLPECLSFRLEFSKPLLKKLSARLAWQYSHMRRSADSGFYVKDGTTRIGRISQPENTLGEVAFSLQYAIN
ncbi:hypothetical protein [Thiomicrorhabdus sp.]|uniref:hypothetical protein n=1 Tax=Thiomicrorhabdus sp. TaxID=2039724 RepID=UPI0029C92041|nr:hypothetical protein [Thiomicrorhabdus sp.]